MFSIYQKHRGGAGDCSSLHLSLCGPQLCTNYRSNTNMKLSAEKTCYCDCFWKLHAVKGCESLSLKITWIFLHTSAFTCKTVCFYLMSQKQSNNLFLIINIDPGLTCILAHLLWFAQRQPIGGGLSSLGWHSHQSGGRTAGPESGPATGCSCGSSAGLQTNISHHPLSSSQPIISALLPTADQSQLQLLLCAAVSQKLIFCFSYT